MGKTMITEPEYFDIVKTNRRMLNHEAAQTLGLTPDAEAVEYVVSGAIQGVWLQLFRREYRTTNLVGHLRIAVRRDARNYLRDAPEEMSLEDLLPASFDGDDPLETLNITYDPPLSVIQDVRMAMAKLTPEQQHVVWGVVVEGLTLVEAGRGVGLNHQEKVKRVLGLALRQLRHALAAYDVRRPPRRGA